MAEKNYGMPGLDMKKGGTISRFMDEINKSMTPAELESYKKRKKLEDEADARRKAEADKNPANRTQITKLSDLFK